MWRWRREPARCCPGPPSPLPSSARPRSERFRRWSPAATPAVPAVSPTDPTAGRGAGDDLPNPLEDKRRALRQEAVADVVSGRAKAEKRGVSTVLNLGRTFGTGTAGGKLPKKGRDQYVELAREKTDKIFVILAEFGNERHPDFPDKDADPNTAGPVTFDGPLHNQIPKPDRSVDNTTNWQAELPGRPLPRAVLRHRQAASSRSRPTTRPSPPGATASTARSPTGSRSSTTRPGTAVPATTRTTPTGTTRPSAPATSATTAGR